MLIINNKKQIYLIEFTNLPKLHKEICYLEEIDNLIEITKKQHKDKLEIIISKWNDDLHSFQQLSFEEKTDLIEKNKTQTEEWAVENLICQIAFEFDDETPELILNRYKIPYTDTDYIDISQLDYPLNLKDENDFKRMILKLRER